MKTVMIWMFRCVSVLLLTGGVFADDYALHTFDRQQLTDVYFSEGIGSGDINGDDVADIVYGPYWFAGPDFKTKQEIFEAVPQNMNRYANCFFSWVHDFNGDGWNDVLVAGFPGTPAYVYENPKADGHGSHWKKHQVFDWVSNESPQLVNLIGDERPELVCTRDGFFGFVTIDTDDPWGTWGFHPISDQVTDKRFGHGMGVGDVNGDGRQDLIHAKGWYEQPDSNADTSRWISHQAKLADGYGGAEMYAYDVDGDGDNDIVTSDAAHDFGLSWYEQIRNGNDVTFKQHQIMGSHASENKYGVLFSEPHSVALADIDGDGLKDIITGKTYWSHHKQSPMWDAGAVVYWFKLVRGKDGVDWIPHRADGEAGIGRQISITDINADGLPDILVGGMRGSHVLIHKKRAVSKKQWQAAQPKIYVGPQAPSTEGAKQSRGPKGAMEANTARVAGAIEGESLKSRTTGGTAKPQNMSRFTADKWSGNAHLWWTGGQPGDELTLDLPTFSGIVDLQIVLTCARDYGIVQLKLDDEPLGHPIDLYETNVVTTGVLSFPELSVKGTKHTLGVTIVGTNPKAKPAHMFAVDYLRIKTANGDFVAGQSDPAVSVALAKDEYRHSGITAVQAAAAMKVPEGFTLSVSASEPDVKQPIAMALDDRGRVWIAEAYEYPIRAKGDKGRDRILIFEDSDGDDVPDSEPQILLDGFGFQDTHETLNTFIWEPDGWLYGCHGVFTHSKVGKPGTPLSQRGGWAIQLAMSDSNKIPLLRAYMVRRIGQQR